MSEGRRFYLQERLGAGAFGEVYLAEQDSGAGFRRRVALKVLNAQVAGFAEAGRRMRDEARILGRLHHRNIVTVLDMVHLDNQWAVVMDYIPGVDLDRMLEALERLDEYVPGPAACEIGAAIAEALDAAYNADDGKGGILKVVHRDVKPSNVLLTKDGDLKVLDFGVARVNLETRESRTGLRVGTERYMSPQRICGEDDDLAGDVYATAATLAELLLRVPIGRTPVDEKKHADFVEQTLSLVRDRLAGPEAAIDELIGLLRRGLHVEAADRPGVRELSEQLLALSRKLEGDGLVAFARRMVPEADRVLENRREKIDGVLSESGARSLSPADTKGGFTAGATGGVTQPSIQPKPTPVGNQAGDTIAFEATPTPSDRRALPIAIAAVVALVAVVGLGGLLVAGLVVTGHLGGSGTSAQAAVEQATPPAGTASATTATTSPPVASTVPATNPTTPATGVATSTDAATSTSAATTATPATTTSTATTAPPGTSDATPTKAPVTTAKTPKTAKTTTTAPTPAPAPAVDPNAARVSRALVVMQDASSIKITCGDTTASGSASARIKDFPSGPCAIAVEYLGKQLTTSVDVDRPREVNCTASGDNLTCN